MKIAKYLDAVMASQGLKTDRQLAELLDVKPNTVSQWRSGTRTVENETCLKIAQLLDMQDPLPVIMAADLDRAERAGQKSLWELFSTRMAHSTAVAVLAVGVAAMATSGKSVARPAGIEPATPAFGGQYSIH